MELSTYIFRQSTHSYKIIDIFFDKIGIVRQEGTLTYWLKITNYQMQQNGIVLYLILALN